MNNYFVSFAYLNEGGEPLFGQASITSKTEIRNIDDVMEIKKSLTKKDVRNVIILNIQKFPI